MENTKRRIVRWVKRILILVIALALAMQASFILRIFYPIHFREKIERHARELDVDPMLITAIIRTESRFRPQVVSNKGAVGLMQIMPDTGVWVAEQMGDIDFEADQLLDPDVNIRLGTWYVNSLQKQFGGNLPVVVAAYNAGRGNVRQWLDNGVWDGTREDAESIPFPETRKFVRLVLKDYDMYHRLYVE